MPGTPGSVWIEGQYLFIIGTDGSTYRYYGETSGGVVSAAIPGSLWIDPQSNRLWYIDGTKTKRSMHLKTVSTKANSVIGSLWMETNRLKWIGSNNMAYIGHGDYTDYGYSDSGYYDSGYNDTDVHLDNGGYVDNYQYRDAGYSDYIDYRYGDSYQNPVKIN